MKVKKITHNHILSWIYALVVAVPLVTIVVRCCYITFNKNAYLSYSSNYQEVVDIETNYRYETNEVTSVADLVEGNIYHINLPKATTYEFYYKPIVYNYNLVATGGNQIANAKLEISSSSMKIRIHNNGTSTGVTISSTSGNSNLINPVYNFSRVEYDFVYQTSDNNDLTNYISYITPSSVNFVDGYTPIYESYSNLDNAFEYSINELTQNGNTGSLNLVNWFGDLFLDMTNAKNQLYLGFINYYMNYVLMVSCVYLLFSVLMWFLTWARRLLSKGLGE